MTGEVATRSGQREALLDYDKLDGIAGVTAREYASAEPYPHAVIDDFLDRDVARRLMTEFPPIDRSSWINWVHVNELKFGRSDRASFPPTIGRVVDELHSRPFIAWLERLTGIAGLLPDPSLEGSGLHQSGRGGFLNIHTDFTGHPHQPTWRRRLNFLLYLNEGWEDGFGGHLEMWSRDMSRCVRKVAPLLNRAVVFETSGAFHGHPEPMACPPEVTRKSIAVYYFTEERQPVAMRSTLYRARPGERWRALPIYLDMLALRLYDRGKRALNLDDRFASRALNFLSRLRGR